MTETLNTRQRADLVAMQDLPRCAAELLAWRKRGTLPEDAFLRQVAAVWAEEDIVDGALQQAEYTVTMLALRQVAGTATSAAPQEGQSE